MENHASDVPIDAYFSMTPLPSPPQQLLLTEDEARPSAKRRSVSPAFATLPRAMPLLHADDVEGEDDDTRVLAKRRSLALQVQPEACFRRLSALDLVDAVDVEEPCAFRNLHFDDSPPSATADTASTASTLPAPASRRGSHAADSCTSLAASRRSSSNNCCHSCHDAGVIANRRRVSCLTEGAATPAVYRCNGARCGGSHHCPEAFDDPCCGNGPATTDFWVQAYYKSEGRRKPGKRQRSKKNSAGGPQIKGGRRASRASSASSSSKRQSLAAALDVEAEKESVTQADKKRRWVVYIFATFVVMLVALAVLMVIVSLTMNNGDKPVSKAAALAVTPASFGDEWVEWE